MNNFDGKRYDFLRKAEECLRQNKLEEALQLAETRRQDFPADVDAIAVCLEALIGMGQLDEMRSLLNDVTEFMSNLNLIYERAGDLCRENGFHQEAAVCYEKFLSLRPDIERSREIINKIASLEQEDRHDVKADLSITKSVPDNNFFTVTMARLYIEQGHLDDAEIILEEILKRDPLNQQAEKLLNNLAREKARSFAIPNKKLKNEKAIQVLSKWLKNIDRLKHEASSK